MQSKGIVYAHPHTLICVSKCVRVCDIVCVTMSMDRDAAFRLGMK